MKESWQTSWQNIGKRKLVFIVSRKIYAKGR